jgi:tetratricopeptide (TPR) repeat protein
MSLLLDALKKAEQARQDAQRGEPRGEDSARQAKAPPAESGARVLTRDRLPDISRPIEIRDDDLVERATQPAEERGPGPGGDGSEAERSAARMVFEAKLPFREPDPHLPFRITLAALGLFTAGAVVYFWLQLKLPAPLVNPNPPRPAGELQSGAAQPPGAAPVARETPPAPRAPEVRSAAPVREAMARVAATAAPARPAPASVAPAVAPPTSRAGGSVAEPSAAMPDDAVRRASRAEPAIHPLVAAGYEAYQVGNLAAAREAYERALREQPDNRDALLGLAAVEMRLGHAQAAEDLYARRLQADPRDPHAQAGLIALRGGLADPVAAETRIKTLLAANPESHALYFALGNQYAQQGRWAEAQQAYSRAYGADTENADFAYNLAVSLDHLRQAKIALGYYRRAIELASKRVVAFDTQAAKARVQELSR